MSKFLTEKVCPICGILKLRKDFGASKSGGYYKIRPFCKPCRSARESESYWKRGGKSVRAKWYRRVRIWHLFDDASRYKKNKSRMDLANKQNLYA